MNHEINVIPLVNGLHEIFRLVIPTLAISHKHEPQGIFPLASFFYTSNIFGIYS